DCGTGHIAAVLKKSDQEIHYHYQREESHNRSNAADDTVNKECVQKRICILHQSADPALEGLDPADQPVRDPCSHRSLGYVEHKEDHECKDRNTDDLMSNNSVDLILHIFVFCKDFSLLYLFYD